jgi:hypothetical protein
VLKQTEPNTKIIDLVTEESEIKEVVFNEGPCFENMSLADLRSHVAQVRPDKSGSLSKASRKVLLSLLAQGKVQ